ncbi:MAG: DUF5808 domain-containing protein [Propionibacteriaceae bacterium]|nr:DUF5808 domain-containing protein [Propionibacteriaceae bacterium]
MNPYTIEVSRHLTGLRRGDREAALADLEELLAGGVTPAELGPAQEYAAALREQLGRPAPRFRLPGSFWPDRAARARWWDPGNPRLFVPRAFGLGWDLNVGTVAVRLGWLRPDDADADVFAAIPDDVRRAQRGVPVVLAAAAALGAARLWRQGPRIPVNFDVAGRVNRWADRRWLLPVVAATGGLAAWGARDADHEDAVVQPALATSATALAVAYVATALASSARPDAARWWVGPVAILTPVAAQLAATVLPLRAGLARVAENSDR